MAAVSLQSSSQYYRWESEEGAVWVVELDR